MLALVDLRVPGSILGTMLGIVLCFIISRLKSVFLNEYQEFETQILLRSNPWLSRSDLFNLSVFGRYSDILIILRLLWNYVIYVNKANVFIQFITHLTLSKWNLEEHFTRHRKNLSLTITPANTGIPTPCWPPPPMNHYVEPSALSQHVTEKQSLGCRCGVCKNA